MTQAKGNAVIGQSGGPTAVINASLAGVLAESQKHNEIDHVYGSLQGILGVITENMIDLGRESAETLARLPATPSAILGSCRHQLAGSDPQRILDVFRAHNVRFFFYIGGNDSMSTAHQIAEFARAAKYDLTVIGIPKTIDNDLAFTDHSPGYGSAARFIALAARDAARDTEAIGNVDSVKIVEIMGRNAGWLTAAATLGREKPGDGPHLVYIPERPLSLEHFLGDVKKTHDEHHHVLIALTETVSDPSGQLLSETMVAGESDSFGHLRRAGLAHVLCRLIERELGLKARYDKPGTIQRSFMAAASPVDVREAVLVGESAVRQAVAGATDRMITLDRTSSDPYRCETGLVELARVAEVERCLPDEFIALSGNDVTPAFASYARPLLGGPFPPYARLEKHLVPRHLSDS
jgi:6-phosphofructokinase